MTQSTEQPTPQKTAPPPKVTKQVKAPQPKQKQDKTRQSLTLTLDPQLIEEIKRRSEKARLSNSRFVEITLRKALRLK